MIYLDFETRSTVGLKACGAARYAEDPSTDVLCMAYAINDLPVQLWLPGEDCPKELRYYINYGMTVEAHSAFFERMIWKHVLVPKYDFPAIKPDQWRCSAARAAALALPRSLEGAGAALGLSIQKSQEGKRIMLKLCKPDSKGKWHNDAADFHTLYQYCKQDVEAERALSQAIPDLSPKELLVWQLDQKINERGIKVDLEAVDASLKIIEQYTERLLAEFRELVGGTIETTGQRDRIIAWLKEEGVHIEGLRKNDVIDILEDQVRLLGQDKARRVLEIRQALSKTSTAKYQALKNCACKDGRIRDTLMYHGASTGRWTGKSIQPQNLPKNVQKIQLDTYFRILKTHPTDIFEFCYPETMDSLSSSIRGSFIPSTGASFIGGDYGAIEARVLFWLAGEEKGLRMFREGQDLYKDLASTIYGVPVKDITKEQREMGKRAILGAGYGLGAEKFMETAKAFARLDISKEMATRVIQAYRAKYSTVVRLWIYQECAMREAVASWQPVTHGRITWLRKDLFLKCQLPSGRYLSYYDPKIEVRKTPWGENKAVVTYMAVNSVTKKWERDSTYGGKIVENLTQAIARDIIAEAMLRVEAKGYEIVLSVHDEILAEKKCGDPKELEKLMVIQPTWGKDIPLKAECWTGGRYSK